MGARRRGEALAAVFISDLHRAVTTARIALPAGHVPLHQDAQLRERVRLRHPQRCPRPRRRRLAPALRRPALPRRPEPPPGPRCHRRVPGRPRHRLRRPTRPADRPLRQPLGPGLPAHRRPPGRPAAPTSAVAPGPALHAARVLALAWSWSWSWPWPWPWPPPA
ncbi:histidine phosphatase family protein [Kitasatospora sp. NPDC101157]|uniref:histidine phosphatase family protein n=1 Tax=Kitasatospora sp. NPDC101157 TaxID=3364098 RepID=UPI00380F6B8D